MLRNIVFLVIAGLLAALFIWAPNYASSTADLLDAEAERAIAAAKDGKWSECEQAVDALKGSLDERVEGLKVLLDHEDVDGLMKSAAVAVAAARQKAADELELELTAFRAALEYVRDIDRLKWTNYL